MPNMLAATKYRYNIPCDLEHPVNECKKWICDRMLTNFFPIYKYIYNPQVRDEPGYDTIWAKSAKIGDVLVWEESRINDTLNNKDKYANQLAWSLDFGTANQEENDTYWDISEWGPLMGDDMDYEIFID